MAEVKSTFPIRVKYPLEVCGITEDTHRELAASFEVVLTDEFKRVVTSNGPEVKELFDSNGEYAGKITVIGGKTINLEFGIGSTNLQVFKNAPSATNPGPGWQVEAELSKKYFGLGENENTWDIFYASRVAVINNV